MEQARSEAGATRRDLLMALAAAPAALALSGPLQAQAVAAPPLKLVSIVARKPGLSVDRFRQHWLGIHGPMARKVPGIQGFILSEAVQDSGVAAPNANYRDAFDGIALIWYPGQEALRSGMASQTAKDWLADGDLFIDRAASRGFFVTEQIVVPPARTEGGIKRTVLLVRKPGTTHEQFMEHWTKTHAALAQGVPGLIGAVFNHIDSALGQPSPHGEIDGIAELWWDSGAANMGGRVVTPQSTAWNADGALFLDQAKTRTMVSLEHVMIDQPHAHR
jgi:uncharacterized protein (TIGR02118 family)